MLLADYMAESGMSCADFGALIGVAPTTVWRYARGIRHPRPKIMRRILEETGGAVTPEDFLYPQQLQDDAPAS